MKVKIIGAGPAGLAAAHAAVGLGADVEVLAPKHRTQQLGPLLIQRPIPGINTDHPDGTIHQIVIGGSIINYRYKLYGDINIGINGDILQPSYPAWRHTETYHELWRRYEHLITDKWVQPWEMGWLPNHADLVISTGNAKALCRDSTHNFRSATVYVTQQCEYPGQPENTIIFNATEGVPWVRSSLVFGNRSTEWHPDNPPASARRIRKPISTNCNCHPRILRTGRFGKWQNETWVDTAYWDTYKAIESMMRHEELVTIK